VSVLGDQKPSEKTTHASVLHLLNMVITYPIVSGFEELEGQHLSAEIDIMLA
jgi:hypothetical protein